MMLFLVIFVLPLVNSATTPCKIESQQTICAEPLVDSATTPCKKEFEETICADFSFSPSLILDSDSNKLTIKNAEGPIIHENFVKLEKVTEFIFSGSNITKIEPGSLCCTPNLTSIRILNNLNFPKITKKNLQGCQSIKKMTLDGDNLEIEGGAFAEMKNLQSLTINGTNLRDLDGRVFRGLESLKTLSIHHSHVTKIGENSFDGLKDVKFVDLQNNKISSVDKNAFKKLSQLKVLNLADNKIKNLTWEEFDGIKTLKVLFLERNDFDTVNVDKLVDSDQDLERIFLSYDRLTPATRKKVEETLPKFNITFIYIGKPYE